MAPLTLTRILTLTLGASQALAAPNVTLDDWSSLRPSENLHWTPCLQDYTCARLEVPLDYGDPARGKTAIAFIRLAATNATNYTQSLLINPGGPGGSGIEAVLSYGSSIAQLLQGQHNVIGFDPRGVGRSGAVLDCWPDDIAGRAQFERLHYSEIPNASETSTGKIFASADFFGKACTPTVGGSSGTAAFVSTPAVARDLLLYVRAEQALTGRSDADTKLWFYGVSYGTVLGATFAHLFPERVGKMVLDGVVDAEDYYSLGWKSNLFDSDKALDVFLQSCFDAGSKDKCAFWGPSVQNLRFRLDRILYGLKYNPIPIAPSELCPLPTLATYSDLKRVALQAMYTPLEGFPSLAAALAGLEQGNTTAYAAAVANGGTPSNSCNYGSTEDVNTLIKCVDGAHKNSSVIEDLAEFEEYVDVLYQQSPFFGDAWPTNSDGVACRSLEVSLPKSGKLNESILETRRTANPILFVTSEIDPVSPKRGAHTMSSVFPGSVVLTQDSVGHSAFTSASTCLLQRIGTYLLQGRLPPANSTCQPDVQPFQ